MDIRVAKLMHALELEEADAAALVEANLGTPMKIKENRGKAEAVVGKKKVAPLFTKPKVPVEQDLSG